MKITEEIFNNIYTKYSQEVFNIAYGYTKNKDDAKDIVQDSFLKLLTKNKNYDSEQGIKYFLIRVVINECINFMKIKEKNKVIKNDEWIMNYPDKKQDDMLYQIDNYLNYLPEKYKKIFILYYYNLMKVKEIALSLNISESAVKKRLERARQLLKELIEGR